MSNKHHVTGKARAGGVVLAAALAVAACGSTKPAASPSTSSATTTASSASTAAGSTTTAGAPSGSTATTALAGGTGTISGPGVTATQIKIGQIATVSGPVPGLFENADDALDAFAAYINSEGGIDGKQLVVVHKDDGYNCVTYTNDLKDLSTQVFAVVGSFTVEDGCGLSILKSDPQLPDIEADILTPDLFSVPNAFAGVTQPPGYMTTGYQWVKDTYPNDITHTAALFSSESAASANNFRLAAQSIGFKYVYTRGFGLTETNFTSDILRMKAEGIKVVDLLAASEETAVSFEQQAAQQNFHPDAVLAPTAYDANFLKSLGNPADASNLVAAIYWPMYLGQDTATNPELALFLSWLAKTHPGDSANLYGSTAWAAAVLFAEAMQAAGPTVTQTSLIQAITNLGPFTANGMDPVTNPGKHLGPVCEIIVGVRNGQFARLDPPTSGYECKGTYFNVPATNG
jgi:ABC-type branched-subunit amino acid transport system substrate-binding protein